MERLDYQVEIARILDNAAKELNEQEFIILIDSIREVVQDYEDLN